MPPEDPNYTPTRDALDPPPLGDRVVLDGTIMPDPVDMPPPRGLLREGPEFRLGAVLGRGGMGVVRAASQVALRRQVAVKMVHRRNPHHEAQLLREAMVTGALEHPNIVPVYALKITDDGPLMAMKEIEGTPWSALIKDHEATVRHTRGVEPLVFHLETLLAVCDAVSFAHSKSIIHRDLKPENVMIGAFGAVYVVDWGIAVAAEEGDHGFPLARDVTTIAGTPGYMAPELARGEGKHIGPATDVFLLGAILHEILTGRRRHPGTTLHQQLAAAMLCEPPELGDDLPPELAGIVEVATRREPSRRYPYVAAFRQAIADYLQHRTSLGLLEEADRRRRILIDLLQRDKTARQSPETIHALSIEARFGYRQALREWGDNRRARKGLQDLVQRTIVWELRRKNRDAVASLLQELPTPRPKLDAALAALDRQLQERAREVEELKQRAEGADPSVGARSRAALVGALALVAGGACAGGAAAAWQLGPWSLGELFAGALVLDGAAVCALVGHALLTRDPVSARVRRLGHAMWFLVTAQLAQALLLGWAPAQALAGAALLLGALALATAVTADLAAAGPAVVFLAAALVAGLWPSAALEVLGAAFVAAGAVYVVHAIGARVVADGG